MQNGTRAVLQRVCVWHESGAVPWLCTVVATLGSSPRPLGSLMGCLDTGEQIGSVSGGCVEDDLLARIRSGEFTNSSAQVVEYGLDPEQNERLGLPCGGRITVLVESFGSEGLEWARQVILALKERRSLLRRFDMAKNRTIIEPVDRARETMFDGSVLQQFFGAKQRMVLIGAGQLAIVLSELAQALDFEVVVTDPRQQVLAQWDGPDVELRGGMPDDVIRELGVDEQTAVITLSHDPRIDDMALMEALTGDAWYVGALGSEKTTQARLERLRFLELPDGAISRLHAPVGLSIGSKTPVEIAVAIMAELIQIRRS
ncbi:MAG: XdhC family protein [Halioglobus sp.]|nr:XdhC family protein [Halioglobus sp.]